MFRVVFGAFSLGDYQQYAFTQESMSLSNEEFLGERVLDRVQARVLDHPGFELFSVPFYARIGRLLV